MTSTDWIGEDRGWLLQDLREQEGGPIVFNGDTYMVTSSEVAGAKTGAQALPKGELGTLIASADPHLFRFSPDDFYPNSAKKPPKEGDTLIWHNLLYAVDNVTYEDDGTATISLNVYSHRKII